MIDNKLLLIKAKEKKEPNYKMIDLMKYIAAIMVICIHCNQLFPQEYLDFFIIIIIMIKFPLNKRFLLLASILGIVTTMILASIFFCYKLDEVIVKFELVPCLWFYFSFILYYMLMKNTAKKVEFKSN